MEKESFDSVCERILSHEHVKNGIGTLGERSLHAVLKNYIENDTSKHEQRIGSFVADIYDGQHITEIQTRNFYSLKKKLSSFLEIAPVTVVYPMSAAKYISWIDPDTGEIVSRRKSPRSGKPADMMHELIHILPFLKDPNLSFRIMYIDMEEFRLMNGWGRDHKHGGVRQERIPKALREEKFINGPEDYAYFIPAALPDEFTVRDYRLCAKVSQTCAQRAVYILELTGNAERFIKKGNAILYRKISGRRSDGKD